jgi:hypothetical protein
MSVQLIAVASHNLTWPVVTADPPALTAATSVKTLPEPSLLPEERAVPFETIVKVVVVDAAEANEDPANNTAASPATRRSLMNGWTRTLLYPVPRCERPHRFETNCQYVDCRCAVPR